MADEATIANAYVQIMPSMKGVSENIRKGLDAENVGTESGKTLGTYIGKGLKTTGKAVGVGLAAGTAATSQFTKASIQAGLEFDKSMAQVAATSGKTMEQLQSETVKTSTAYGEFEGDLRDFAQYMGSNTAFSATQAADALNYMALAGYDAQTSVEMLPNVLNLAAAGNIDLAYASDMVTDASSALGLNMEETASLVDKMAAASANSNTSVSQLGDAILTVGGTAKSLSGGTTELSTALGILADNGIKGAEGGTALRNIILSLGAPTDKAAALMEELGLQVYDADGNLRPLNDTFEDLNTVLGGMTEQQRTEVLSTLFNNVDLKSANALLANSGDRFDELSAAIDGSWYSTSSLTEELGKLGVDLSSAQTDLGNLGITSDELSSALSGCGGNAGDFVDKLISAADEGVTYDDIVNTLGGDLDNLQTAFDNTTGSAQAMADTQLDSLSGDITLFQSALEGAEIAVSDKLSPTLRTFVQEGTTLVSDLTAGFQEDGLAGALDVATDRVQSFGEELKLEAISELKERFPETMGTIETSLDTVKEPIDTFKESIGNAATQLNDSLSPAVEAINGILPTTDTSFDLLASTVTDKLVSGLDTATSFINDNVTPALTNLGSFVDETVPKVEEFASSAKDTLSGAWQTASSTMQETVMPAFEGASSYITDTAIPNLQSFATEAGTNLVSAWETASTFMSETVLPALSSVSDYVTGTAIPAIQDFAADPATGLQNAFEAVKTKAEDLSTHLSEKFPEATATAESVATSFKDNFGGVWDTLGETFSGVWETINSNLSGEGFSSAIESVTGKFETLGPTIESVVGFAGSLAETSIPLVVSALETFDSTVGPIRDSITTMVGESLPTLGTTIEGLVEPITGVFDALSNSGVTDSVLGLVQTASDLLPGIIDTGGQLVDSVLGGVESFVENASPGVSSFIDSLSNAADQVFPALQTAVEALSGPLEGFLGFVGDIAGGALDLASNIIDNAVPGITTLIEEGGKIGADIITGITNLPSDMQAIWDDISSAAETSWNNIQGFIDDPIGSITSGIDSFVAGTQSQFASWGIDIDVQSTWDNLKGFVDDPVGALTTSISGFTTGVSSAFEYWGIDSTVNTIWTSLQGFVDDPVGSLTTGISGFISDIASDFSNWGIDTTVDGIFQNVQSFMQDPIGAAKDFITGDAGPLSLIKGAFDGLDLHFPEIKLPHVTISGGYFNDIFDWEMPTFGIEWYASGGIFNSPNLIGIGEAGAEAVIPLDNRMYIRPFANAIADEINNLSDIQEGPIYNLFFDNLKYNDDEAVRAVTRDYITSLIRLGAI